MIKIFLGIVLIATTSYIGYRFADKYKYRLFVFETLYKFNLTTVSQIGVTNVSVADGVDLLKKNIPDVMKNSDKFLNGEVFSCEDKRLTIEQKTLVSDYINVLGTSDVFNQKQILNSFGERLNNELLSSKTKCSNFSKLSVRLGFSIGLMIVVIIM